MSTELSARVMPQSTEAEIAVLGGCILTPNECLDETILQASEDHFYQRSHKIIFNALSDLRATGSPIDAITLTTKLKDAGKLEEVGGAYYISKVSGAFPTTAHLAFYLELLKKKHQLRQMISLGSVMIHESYSAEEPGPILERHDQELFEITKAAGTSGQNRLQSAADKVQLAIEARKRGDRVTGLQTGILTLDNVFYGLQRSQYTILAGRPSSGKTALLDQIVMNVVLRDEPTLYIPLESDETRIVGKMACKIADVAYSDFVRCQLDPKGLWEVETALKLLRSKPLFVVIPQQITVGEIRATFMRHARQMDLKLFCIDYIQKIPVSPGSDERRTISEASMMFQRCSIETGVPSLVLAQLNRTADSAPRPRMSHLKESGQLEQDADNILMLWSEKDPHEVTDPLLETTFSIEKNKDGASGLDEHMLFDRPLLKFKEKAREAKGYQP